MSAYLPSVLAMLAGNILLLSSALVLSGLLISSFAILVIDGLSKILTVWRKPPTERVPAVVNALVDFACAALLWYLSRIIGAELAVGIIIGAYIAASGWRMLMAPAEAVTPAATPARRPSTRTLGSASLRTRPSRNCASKSTAQRKRCAPPISCGC